MTCCTAQAKEYTHIPAIYRCAIMTFRNVNCRLREFFIYVYDVRVYTEEC